jgi:hypothetical protein
VSRPLATRCSDPVAASASPGRSAHGAEDGSVEARRHASMSRRFPNSISNLV